MEKRTAIIFATSDLSFGVFEDDDQVYDQQWLIDSGSGQDLISKIEELSGQKFDIEKVRKAVKHTSNSFVEWKRFLKCAENQPSGITAFDSFVQMAPFITMRGTEDLENHFSLIADEAEERVSEGNFPVPEEKYRLLWDNIAPWHQLRAMQQKLSEKGVNIVSASYTYHMGCIEGEYDPSLYNDKNDPLEYLARGQNFALCAHGMTLRRSTMKEAIKRTNIDGAIFASNRSCKPFSLMQMDQKNRIVKECGIPAVMIDLDHADERNYNEDNIFLRIEALLENIDADRKQAV